MVENILNKIIKKKEKKLSELKKTISIDSLNEKIGYVRKGNHVNVYSDSGNQKEKIMSLMGDDYLYAIQNNQLGTADAVRTASSIIEKYEISL